MAPKGKVVKTSSLKRTAVKPLDWETLNEDVVDIQETEDAVFEALQTILGKCRSVLQLHKLEAQATKEAAEDVAACLSDATSQFQLLWHDFGERSQKQDGKPDTALSEEIYSNQIWQAEPEPASFEIDRVGRHSVTSRFTLPSPPVVGMSRGATRGRIESGGVESRQSLYSSNGGAFRRRKKVQDPQPVGPFPLEKVEPENHKMIEATRNAELKRMRLKRKKELEAEQQERELEEEKRRNAEQLEMLADKDYTYDDKGEIILVKPLAPTRVPPTSLEPKTQLLSEKEIQNALKNKTAKGNKTKAKKK